MSFYEVLPLVPTDFSNSFFSWMVEKEAEPDENIDELQK